MKLFLLGHVSMVLILCLIFIVAILFDDVPKGYRWMATKATIWGIKRLGHKVQYRFSHWLVDGQIVWSFNHMTMLVNRGYKKDYKNITVSYDQRMHGYDVRTVRKRVMDYELSMLSTRYCEKRFLEIVWEKHGRGEKTYPHFAQKLNDIAET